MSKLKNYIVLFRDDSDYLVDPSGFRVLAEDYIHAEEQLLDVDPNVDILWVAETDDYDTALDNYYGALE